MEKEINKILGDLLIQLAQKNMGALDEIHHLVGKALYAIGNKFFYQKADIEDTIHDLYYLISKKAHKYPEVTLVHGLRRFSKIWRRTD